MRLPSMKLLPSILLVLLLLSACRTPVRETTVRILHTSDVHGNFFPIDFFTDSAGSGSMARLCTYVNEARRGSSPVLLFDGGDILQGTPVVYYSNYIDTLRPNIAAEVMNYLKYDLAVPGNHDIEPGHSVYDKWIRECRFPVVCANILNEKSGKPYLSPYKVFETNGIRILVVGFITPAIPQWVPESKWNGLRFEDIDSCARRIMPDILRKEKPDISIGVLHSGLINDNALCIENAGQSLARNIPGFDALFIGHDHRQSISRVVNPRGDTVPVIDPANHLDLVSSLNIRILKRGDKPVSKYLEADLIRLDSVSPDRDFLFRFAPFIREVKTYTKKPIGYLTCPLDARSSLFGSSNFLSLIHAAERRFGKADISFAAPLNPAEIFPAGELCVRDMFRIYPFENYLYTLDLTGQEIHRYLEYSYAHWCNQMKTPSDHLIRFRPDFKPNDKYKTETPFFNYSSASGIRYEVDVTKPAGERVRILSLSDGRAFDPAAHYRVAMSSYRAGGGGGLLTDGVGLTKTELAHRIQEIQPGDLRDLVMRYIEEKGTFCPTDENNWRFIPQSLVLPAAKRDFEIIYP